MEEQNIAQHRERLLALRKEWLATWEEYSYAARLEAGEALYELYDQGVSITKLGTLWGSKDRRTLMDLMALTGKYRPRKIRKKVKVSAPTWKLNENYTIEADGTRMTITVPDVTVVPWTDAAKVMEPKMGLAQATWDQGLFISGDRKLHAEVKGGNTTLGRHAQI